LRINGTENRVVVHENGVAGHGEDGSGGHRSVRHDEIHFLVEGAEHTNNSLDDLHHAAGRVEDHNELFPLRITWLDGHPDAVLESPRDRRDDRDSIRAESLLDLAKTSICPLLDAEIGWRWYEGAGGHVGTP